MDKLLQGVAGLNQEEEVDCSLTRISDFWKCDQNKQQGFTDFDEHQMTHYDSRINPARIIKNIKSYADLSEQSMTSTQSETNNFLERTVKIDHNNKKYSILICTDFAFPKFGGVETHGYQLGQCLIERGHKVTFITNKFQGTRCGVRYMANGMKVYHIPHEPVCNGDVAFVTFFNSVPLIRQILIREQIEIVHGHQSVSILQHIILMAAKSMGLKTVFTEHSLFCYNDFTGIHLNKLVKWCFRDLDAAICVSHACKDNFVLRAKFDPRKTFTIPNAVDSDKFTPDPTIRQKDIEKSGNPDQINIVFISRLAYRKGVDLLIGIIPKILAQFKNVHFIIGGDGEGMNQLQALVQKHNLHGRVELLGGLPHDQVRDVLCRGHIFLNTSLTESFCIAILEAACCGLLVVSTDVGGVPEVLPPHMAYLAKPEEKSILRQLRRAIVNVKDIPCETFYNDVANLYSWRQVAERTEKVYDFAVQQPSPNMLVRLKTSLTVGSFAGIWALMYTLMEAITLFIVEIMFPESEIDILPSFNPNTVIQTEEDGCLKKYCEEQLAYGDHLFRVNTLKDHSNNCTAFNNSAGEPQIIDLYRDQYKKKLSQPPCNKIEPIIRQVRRSNRYTVVRPQDSDLQQTEKEETENSQFSEVNTISDIWMEDSYSSNSSCVVDSQITTSAEKSNQNDQQQKAHTQKRKVRAMRKYHKEHPVYCSSCMQRLQPYECAINFMNSQHEFDKKLILQSFQQLSYESQQRSKKKKMVQTSARRHNNITDDFTGASSASSSESNHTFHASLIEGLNYVQQQQSNDITNCSQGSSNSRIKQPVRLLDTHTRSETPPRLNSYKLQNDTLECIATPQMRGKLRK